MSSGIEALSEAQIERFIVDGFVRIDEAFSPSVAEGCRAVLWKALGLSPEDRSSWTKPVVRLGDFADPPFREAANAPKLHSAFDALVGRGRWLPRMSLGTFPVRFPSAEDPGDAGWHIDVSLDWESKPDFLDWRANLLSEGRSLLMLFLFSDVGEDDAPTRLRVGSHRDIARRLAPHGERGLTLRELASTGFAESAHRPEALATGDAGTVYLCHPFVVHSAQLHRGTRPRLLAQPPLLPRDALALERTDGSYSPVEEAIRRALVLPAPTSSR